jgi:predicted DNA-binding transcriptional regulator AlpA
MSTAPFPGSAAEQPHNRAVWSGARCARLFRPFEVDSPPKGSLTVRPPRFLLNVADTTRCRLALMRERKHPSTKTRSSPDKQTQRLARETKRLAGKRDELIGTVYELYGRCNEVVLRLQDDARTLVNLHQETTELLYILRSLPSERPPAQVATPAVAAPPRNSGPRLPRLISFREVAQRVGLSRSSVWRMERAGQFPKRRRLSVNRVAWWEPEVEEWMRNRHASIAASSE